MITEQCIDDNAYFKFKFALSRIENIRYINSYQSFNEHVEIYRSYRGKNSY